MKLLQSIVALNSVKKFIYLILAVDIGYISAKAAEDVKCEPITVSMCSSDIPYDRTIFPNVVGHMTQRDARYILGSFTPLVQNNCSDHLKEFLCRVYVPECGKEGRKQVCRSLCEAAQGGCANVLESFGFQWPSTLNCSNFPISNCNGSPTTTTPITTIPTTTISSQADNPICEPITLPMCSRDVSYNTTIFPNMLGHANQEEAGLMVHQYYPLVKIGCSSYLQKFLCRVYVPECGKQRKKPPCRSFCKATKKGCIKIIRSFNFRWPTDLKCSKFPTSNCERSPTPTKTTPAATTPATTILSQDNPTCEPITLPMCSRDVSYNTTIFPNTLGHVNQEEAGLIVNQYYPLVEFGCSPYTREFLCRFYVPECDKLGRKPACRSLCEAAQAGCANVLESFGFQWHSTLNCSNFPTSNCKDLPTITTTPTKNIPTIPPRESSHAKSHTIKRLLQKSSSSTEKIKEMIKKIERFISNANRLSKSHDKVEIEGYDIAVATISKLKTNIEQLSRTLENMTG